MATPHLGLMMILDDNDPTGSRRTSSPRPPGIHTKDYIIAKITDYSLIAAQSNHKLSQEQRYHPGTRKNSNCNCSIVEHGSQVMTSLMMHTP